jgi:hypothetical protein
MWVFLKCKIYILHCLYDLGFYLNSSQHKILKFLSRGDGVRGVGGWWRMMEWSVRVAGMFLPVNYSNNFCLRFISKLKPIFWEVDAWDGVKRAEGVWESSPQKYFNIL